MCTQKQINFLGHSKLGSRFLERDRPHAPTMWEAWPPPDGSSEALSDGDVSLWLVMASFSFVPGCSGFTRGKMTT